MTSFESSRETSFWLHFGEGIENMYIWKGEGRKNTLFGLKRTDNLIGHGLNNSLFK